MPDSDDSTPPAFLAISDHLPAAFRDLLGEAEACREKGFLTGGTACAQRALELLMSVAKAEGTAYEDGLRSLGERGYGVPQMLASILVQCGTAAKNGATLNVEVLHLFILTMKAVLYELYVVGPERTNRLQYISRLVRSVQHGSPAEGGDATHHSSLALPVIEDGADGSSSNLDAFGEDPERNAGHLPALQGAHE